MITLLVIVVVWVDVATMVDAEECNPVTVSWFGSSGIGRRRPPKTLDPVAVGVLPLEISRPSFELSTGNSFAREDQLPSGSSFWSERTSSGKTVSPPCLTRSVLIALERNPACPVIVVGATGNVGASVFEAENSAFSLIDGKLNFPSTSLKPSLKSPPAFGAIRGNASTGPPKLLLISSSSSIAFSFFLTRTFFTFLLLGARRFVSVSHCNGSDVGACPCSRLCFPETASRFLGFDRKVIFLTSSHHPQPSTLWCKQLLPEKKKKNWTNFTSSVPFLPCLLPSFNGFNKNKITLSVAAAWWGAASPVGPPRSPACCPPLCPAQPPHPPAPPAHLTPLLIL